MIKVYRRSIAQHKQSHHGNVYQIGTVRQTTQRFKHPMMEDPPHSRCHAIDKSDQEQPTEKAPGVLHYREVDSYPQRRLLEVVHVEDVVYQKAADGEWDDQKPQDAEPLEWTEVVLNWK